MKILDPPNEKWLSPISVGNTDPPLKLSQSCLGCTWTPSRDDTVQHHLSPTTTPCHPNTATSASGLCRRPTTAAANCVYSTSQRPKSITDRRSTIGVNSVRTLFPLDELITEIGALRKF
jgi:hypothetical protein